MMLLFFVSQKVKGYAPQIEQWLLAVQHRTTRLTASYACKCQVFRFNIVDLTAI